MRTQLADTLDQMQRPSVKPRDPAHLPAKALRQTAKPERHLPTRRSKHPSISDLQNQVSALARELAEARAEQSASAEVLRVISSSPAELQPVFQIILENATRICEAKFGTLWVAEADGLRAVAMHNPPAGFADMRLGALIRPSPSTATGRAQTTKQVAQVVDLAADAAYLNRDPLRVGLVEVAGARSLVSVPMLKENEFAGAINIYRQEPGPFTDRQLALLQNFAAQAVIAIENARLLSELRERTTRLEQEMDAARKLQLGMLPMVFPACTPERPVEVHALMETAREVGGDLYDFFYASEHLFCFLVGDVSGKGAAAAMFMARTRGLVRMAVELWRKMSADQITPMHIADAINHELCQNNRDHMFVTLFLGMLDTKTGVITYVNAGHLGPYVLHPGGSIDVINDKPALPLAVRAGVAYQERTLMLRPDDTLFVFSDGVIEAMNIADDLYGKDRLHADLCIASALPPEQIVRGIKAKIDSFTTGTPKFDDVTMLALRWQPNGSKRTKSNEVQLSGKESLPHTTRIVIRNNLANLATVTATMERLGAEYRMPENFLLQLQIVLDEMLSNIIKYAWPEGGEHEIEILMTVRTDAVEVEIIDDGEMFDPRDTVPRDKPLPGQKLQPGGLGVRITKQLVDRIDYARIGNRNHITLRKLYASGLLASGRKKHMSQTALRLVDSHSGLVCILAISGRIDSGNAETLLERLNQLVSSGEKTILLDFKEVLYLTSAAFRVLLVAADEAEHNGGRIILCGLAGQVRELFEMGGLLEAFTVHGSREDALASL